MLPNSPNVRLIDVLVVLHHSTWRYLIALGKVGDPAKVVFRVTFGTIKQENKSQPINSLIHRQSAINAQHSPHEDSGELRTIIVWIAFPCSAASCHSPCRYFVHVYHFIRCICQMW